MLAKQLDDREMVRFLDEKDLAAAAALRAKPTLTADEKKQLDNFHATSKSRGDQLRALQQNPNKTEAEKTDFDRLTKLSSKTDDEITAVSEQLDAQLKAMGEKLGKQLTDTVTAAITEVAKEKSYTAVLDKHAVMVGGTDVTDDVLKRLNKE